MENKQSSGGRAELISGLQCGKAAAVHQLINTIVSLILFLAFAAGFAYRGAMVLLPGSLSSFIFLR